MLLDNTHNIGCFQLDHLYPCWLDILYSLDFHSGSCKIQTGSQSILQIRLVQIQHRILEEWKTNLMDRVNCLHTTLI